ncbi:hypothetical protein IM792_11210 [Mucilaginibacter sp. JRF]|uniref:hypothetical protein n=1 Tax=Mucilaginibacter sp. JRF TaxID=2780088 RepID=UPI0018826D77|nr:hypothetical protein [Mucilaginibacter sp. JRF]MBE9585018.1 hypothetical protein [Mucilaginibacter sp. JRF]
MKKALLTLVLVFGVFFYSFAQADKIVKHSGETVEANVIRVAEFTVIFKYVNEDAEQVVSKYAIEKIVYGKSGRTEKLTDKIVVAGKNDWEKVIVLEDKSEIAGLSKGGDIKGKTAFINFHTGSSSEKSAEKKLKQAAAELGCPFVLITFEKATNVANGGLGGNQDIKKGIAYKYM